MKPLRFVTVQAENTVSVADALAEWLTANGPVPVQFEPTDDWQQAYNDVEAGVIELAWICGWPYVQMAAKVEPPVELLVAPVMNGERYADRPIYFSDVVVRKDRQFRTFADLRGAHWAINEPGSQSGYHITRYRLATMGESGDFFGCVEQAGSHAAALTAVLEGTTDAAAIDSTLLSWMVRRDPSLTERLRIIDMLGPSPIPPIVAARKVERPVSDHLRLLLSTMHNSASGRAVLRKGDLRRFAIVDDAGYDPIREMAAASRHISLAVGERPI